MKKNRIIIFGGILAIIFKITAVWVEKTVKLTYAKTNDLDYLADMMFNVLLIDLLFYLSIIIIIVGLMMFFIKKRTRKE